MALQVLVMFLSLALAANTEEFQNPHPNHRHSFMSSKELTDHWIGMPKSPYAHYTARPTPAPTSAPVRPPTTTTRPPRKRKSTPKRRREEDFYKTTQRRRADDDKEDYDDYDYEPPTYAEPPPPRKVYMSGSSPSSSMIFAGVPKVATYVVPSSKRYTVQRVQSQAMYVPPVSAVRRVDPLDYDDDAGDGALLGGTRNSFPPRAVMNKIAPAGQEQQPCHGPECHQHHKGLVRFYWRRLVYPPNSRQRRRRRPGQFRRRPGGRRGGGASPSDIAETYAEDDEEEADGSDDRDEDEEENDEDVGDESRRRRRWRPGRGYGHDWDEGSNYGNDDRMVYRDKRYAYNRRRGARNGYYGSQTN